MVSLRVIMDNHCTENKSLIAEHGFSCLVTMNNNFRILFDFGSGIHTLENAKALGIPLEDINCAVCSHAHYDHGGGYKFFVEEGLKAPIITGKGFFVHKYAKEGNKISDLGINFDDSYLKVKNIFHKECNDVLKVTDGCFAVGGFKRSNDFEKIPEKFVIYEGERIIQDKFNDEICLVIETQKGLVILVGCSHPGIVNIVSDIKERFQRDIYAVVGGIHLVNADDDRIINTIKMMKDMGVKVLGFNHCSGAHVNEVSKRDKDIDSFYLGSGDMLEII